MIIKEYVPYTKKVEVTEHRAPTDESIRLYKEMEEKAITNIIHKEKFDDNEINGVVICVERSFRIDCVTAHLLFSLNGKKYHEKVNIERTMVMQRDQLRRLLYLAVIEKLALMFDVEFQKIQL